MTDTDDERLREIPRVRQHRGDEGHRRWFSSSSVDLYVWESDGAIGRFELCYGKPAAEHVLAWSLERGLHHAAVDDGEQHPMSSRTPIVVPDGTFDAEAVALEFERVAAGVEPCVYRFVLARLHAGT